jgi:hypothetical protein
MSAVHLRMPLAKGRGFAGAFDIHRTTVTRQAPMSTGFRLVVVW